MTRLVSEVRPLDRRKSLVCLEDGERFPLYGGELRRFRIEAGCELADETYGQLMEVLKKRARLRCLHLLQKADKTEEQLRRKLKEGGYPPFLVEDALEYVRGFHYVDDARYAAQYVRQCGERKSRRQLMCELARRGIDREIIQEAFAGEDVDEEAAAERFARKKLASVRPCEEADWRKIYRSLAAKGYGFDVAERVIVRLRREYGDGSPDSV